MNNNDKLITVIRRNARFIAEEMIAPVAAATLCEQQQQIEALQQQLRALQQAQLRVLIDELTGKI